MHRRLTMCGRSLALAMLACLPATAAHATMYLSDYLEINEGKRIDLSPEVALVYLWGALDGAYSTNEILVEQAGVTAFCLPEGEPPLSVGKFEAEVKVTIAELRRETLDFDLFARETSLGKIGMFTLSRLYPCEAGEDAAADDGA